MRSWSSCPATAQSFSAIIASAFVASNAQHFGLGRYRLSGLIEERGRDGKIVDWLDALTDHCPVKKAHNWNDQCAARCPELAKVL